MSPPVINNNTDNHILISYPTPAARKAKWLLILLGFGLIAASIALTYKNFTDIVKQYKLERCNQTMNDKILTLEMIKLGDTYYFFSKIKKSWSQAKLECETRGLNLVSLPEDDPRSKLLLKYLGNLHLHSATDYSVFWTSGKEIFVGDFIWTTLEPPSNTLSSNIINTRALVVSNNNSSLRSQQYKTSTNFSGYYGNNTERYDSNSSLRLQYDTTTNLPVDHGTNTEIYDSNSSPRPSDNYRETVEVPENYGQATRSQLDTKVGHRKCVNLQISGSETVLMSDDCKVRHRYACQMPITCQFWQY